MAGQETLIYIDENDEKNAGISAKKFTKEDLKNRAYYNILGANLVKKFLADKDIEVSDIYNIHNINKVLEELDISDIMLKNIHIDVRVIFNENYIFIPKSHFEYDILPDIYVVLQMSTDKKYTKFLGFFEPKLINKNNENEEYYFIEKEKLTSPENLKEFVQNFKGNTSEKLSDSETDESDMLILSLIDQDISEKDKKLLLKNLTKSAELRDRFIEFENFEMLSYRAEHSADLNINDSLNTDENMILSLDEAAEATAEVLKEYTKAHIVDQISKEEEIINGFNNLERNLPDFTPENADKTIDEYEKDFMNINIDELPFENNETIIDATEQNQVEISEISTSIDSDQTPEETEEIIDFESFENTTEFDKNEVTTQNEENTIINLEELPIVETSNNISTTEIPQDIVNLDEIAPVNEEKKDFIDNSQDTVDLDEIETINQESPHHNIETEPETLNFEDIAPNIEEDLLTVDIQETEPELESFDEISINNEEIQEKANSNIDDIEIENLENINEESELTLDGDISSELSFDENLTIDEDINSDIELSSDKETLDNTASEDIETEEEKEKEETNLVENVTLNNEENILMDLDSIDQSEINSEDKADLDQNIELKTNEENQENISIETEQDTIEADKELDQMLALENLSEESLIDESEEKSIEESEEYQTNANSSESPEDINIDDLKELGLNVEELPEGNNENEDVNTGDLIAEIDDLLNSEENPDNIPKQVESNDEDSTKNKLEMLFNSSDQNDEDESLLDEENDNSISQEKVSAPEKGKKAIIIAAALVAVLAAAAGTGLFLKNKNNNNSDILAQNPIENDTANIPTENTIPNNAEANTNLIANTPESGLPQPAPAGNNNTTKQEKPKAPVQAEKTAPQTQQATKPNITGTPTPYVSIKSLTWEVPDYLSYSDKVKKYLQTAGKSIRLTLSSDLLLATEYAYSNQVKVAIKLKNDGTIQDIQISKSSGSNQINDIVLRTVKDTLNVVKPAPGEIPGNEFNLGLIINF